MPLDDPVTIATAPEVSGRPWWSPPSARLIACDSAVLRSSCPKPAIRAQTSAAAVPKPSGRSARRSCRDPSSPPANRHASVRCPMQRQIARLRPASISPTRRAGVLDAFRCLSARMASNSAAVPSSAKQTFTADAAPAPHDDPRLEQCSIPQAATRRHRRRQVERRTRGLIRGRRRRRRQGQPLPISCVGGDCLARHRC